MPNGDHVNYSAYDLSQAVDQTAAETALSMLRAVINTAQYRLGGRVGALVKLAAREGIEDELRTALIERRAAVVAEAQERTAAEYRAIDGLTDGIPHGGDDPE